MTSHSRESLQPNLVSQGLNANWLRFFQSYRRGIPMRLANTVLAVWLLGSEPLSKMLEDKCRSSRERESNN